MDGYTITTYNNDICTHRHVDVDMRAILIRLFIIIIVHDRLT